ncbi:MAG: uracil-DNA glycosylase [Pirellulaceae bacterium]|nr:MAG: uracil-DNA glycosylase [Pirellulaceae bacterium]
MDPWVELQQRIVACNRCPRLRSYCRQVARQKRAAFRDWSYWGQPVPNFGTPPAALLVVGLAPAAHGANRTGRMFTGDRSGQWLYGALYRAGFANQPESTSSRDSLELLDAVVTAVAHCAPPQNRLTAQEIENCRSFLEQTILLVQPRVIVALGAVAWRETGRVLKSIGWHHGTWLKFQHGARVSLDRCTVLASYHPSQQNTFTGKLTESMFDAVFQEARKRVDDAKSPSGSGNA